MNMKYDPKVVVNNELYGCILDQFYWVLILGARPTQLNLMARAGITKLQ